MGTPVGLRRVQRDRDHSGARSRRHNCRSALDLRAPNARTERAYRTSPLEPCQARPIGTYVLVALCAQIAGSGALRLGELGVVLCSSGSTRQALSRRSRQSAGIRRNSHPSVGFARVVLPSPGMAGLLAVSYGKAGPQNCESPLPCGQVCSLRVDPFRPRVSVDPIGRTVNAWVLLLVTS